MLSNYILPDYIRENLEACDKEQLIWIIEQYWGKEFNISEICVDESKYHYSSAMAVDKIRDELRSIDFPFHNNADDFLAFLDYKMKKIDMYEYRKRLGLDD